MLAHASHIDVSRARELVRALKRRRQQLGLSCEAVDEIAGLSDRYMNKLENFQSNNGRGLGLTSLELVLEALNARLVFVPRARPTRKRR